MTMPSIDELFQDVEDLSSEKIILGLITDDDNVALKTEIPNPLALTRFMVLIDAFEKINCPRTAAILESFVKNYRINMISYQRKSRKEIENMISGISERNKDRLKDKLMGVKEE